MRDIDNRPLTDTQKERFWRLVTKKPGPCWLWRGQVDDDGLGTYGRTLGSKRPDVIAFRMSGGEFADDDALDHTCGVPLCCNPDHMQAGQLRLRTDSKLTPADVVNIDRALRGGSVQAELARSYGVARNTISQIATGKTWGQITGRTNRGKARRAERRRCSGPVALSETLGSALAITGRIKSLQRGTRDALVAQVADLLARVESLDISP